MQKQRYIGVDYHKRYTYMAIVDEKGKIVREGAVSNQREVILDFLTKAGCNGNSAAVLEASPIGQ